MANSSGAEEEKPLRKMAEAFTGLAKQIEAEGQGGGGAHLELGPFSQACSLVSPLFRCLGVAFKFAELDYIAKVNDLTEASKSIVTLQEMIDQDLRANCVKKAGSHTRNLLRVNRGIDMVKILFEQILASESNFLRDPASTAYGRVFAPYHGWAIRKAVAVGMYVLPTKAQLLVKLDEEESSARIYMQNYIASSASVITYINKLFISKELSTDW